MVNNTSLVSVAILNTNIDYTKLYSLHDALATQFQYFEILLLNPNFIQNPTSHNHISSHSHLGNNITLSTPPPPNDLIVP